MEHNGVPWGKVKWNATPFITNIPTKPALIYTNGDCIIMLIMNVPTCTASGNTRSCPR